MNVCLTKKLDATIGSILASVFPRPLYRESTRPISSFLLIRPGGIGDAVLLSQSIISIREFFPNSHITILAERRNSGVFSLIPNADTVLCYDRPGELIQALLGKYDVVIDTEQWHRLSAVVARLISASLKIGFDINERRRMFTHGVRYDLDAYESDNFFALLEPLGVDYYRGVEKVTLSVPLQSVSKADKLLQTLSSESFVVIFSGASNEWKRWGVDHFSQVSKKLAEEGYRVVVVGGEEDRANGDEIAGDTGLNLAGKTTLAETAAVIARSYLVISGDSGVLHIAVSLNIPTVSLFGPSREAKWAPKGEKHIVINHHLPCSPCSKFGTIPPCPINSCCIKDIMPDEVMEAIGRLLPQPP